jgi:sigma-B regulation protein RsbU (phosphoserine phosphatase)
MSVDPVIADPAELELEIRRLRAELDAERRRLQDELAFARRVQLNLMPLSPPRVRGWEIATAYRPARQVGGDFFDLYTLPGRPWLIGFVVADVTGKGITAALMMAFSRAVLRSAAYNGSGPADAIRRTNRVLVREARTGLFLTAFVGLLDTRTGDLRWASAGHEAPVVVRRDSGRGSRLTRLSRLSAAGSLLGLFDPLPVRDRSTALRPGDALVAHTDGVTDARDPQGEFFGEGRYLDVLRRQAGDGSARLVRAVASAVEGFQADAPPADDLTLLAISRAKGDRSA